MKSIEEGIQNVVKSKEMNLKLLNTEFSKLNYSDRLKRVFELFDPEDILVTTSFGTRSVFLLNLIRKIRPDHKIHFVNTTYHFNETLDYKNKLTNQWNLNLVELFPDPIQNQLTQDESWWKDHPRMCCTINKIAPLDPIIAQHKIWISGLMSDQTELRSHLKIFEAKGDIIKFHPMIDLQKNTFDDVFQQEDLEKHPLIEQGYGSVGCTHCTEPGEDRTGRWCNTNKTECGLHLSFFYKK